MNEGSLCACFFFLIQSCFSLLSFMNVSAGAAKVFKYA